MILIANLLLLLTGGSCLLFVATVRRAGPEGPVGLHMLTGLLALGQVVAIAVALGGGALTATGSFATAVGWSLPGHFVAMTLLPFAALSPRWRGLAVGATATAIVGSGLVVNGGVVPFGAAVVGGVVVLASAAAGYGVVLTCWVARQRQRAAAAVAEVERQNEFERTRSAWELGEWKKLPAQAELWQLIQFAYAMHPEVREQCQARIAALPELDRRMDELLRTGWAELALHYVAHDYPSSRAPLASALAPFLDSECGKWEPQLRDAAMPETWAVNLSKYVECMRAVIADGGDLRAQAQRWRSMLRSIRGLSPLAEQLAA